MDCEIGAGIGTFDDAGCCCDGTDCALNIAGCKGKLEEVDAATGV